MKIRSPLLHLLLIASFAIVVYSDTFSVPFHFDDKLNIVDNAKIKNLKNFWPPSGTRWFGYLTFALNYRFEGLNTTGYHAVNLGIHIMNSFLVYWLVLLTRATPFFLNDQEKKTGYTLAACAAALLFAVHPVQTQAVTYIVQRFASLAAFFYLLSLTLYAKARILGVQGRSAESQDRRSLTSSRLLYAISLLSALLAMKTKETAFTLPLAVIAYEVCFFSRKDRNHFGPGGKRIFYLLPFLVMLFIIPLTVTTGATMHDIISSLSATNEISRHDYLFTQFRVLTRYLGLLFFPLGQSVDHDITVSRTFFDPEVLASFFVLAALFSLGVFLFSRSRSSYRPARVIAFGIFWFFITLSVESSIIPIADVMVEHRLYLPAVGIFLAIVAAFASVVEALQARYRTAVPLGAAAGLLVIVFLSGAAYARNTVWASELSVWKDVVQVYPGNARAHNMLGILYENQKRLDEATARYRAAIALNPFFAEAHVNLGRRYVEGHLFDEAMREFITALKLGTLDAVDTANLYINIGYCYQKKGLPDKAIEFYYYAAAIVPDDANVYSYLARAYEAKGMQEKAVEYFGKARQLNPDRFYSE